MPSDHPSGTDAPLNDADLRHPETDDAVVSRAVTIGRSSEDLYAH